MTTEAEAGMMQPETKEHLEPLEAGSGNRFSLTAFGGSSALQPLDFELQTSETMGELISAVSRQQIYGNL